MSRESPLPRRGFLKAAGLAAPVWSAAVAGGRPGPAEAAEAKAAAADGSQEAGQGLTRRLAGFVVESRAEAIPAAARKEAVRSIVNYVGCAVGGSAHETVDRALAALAPFSGPPQASVMGRKRRLDILHAALLNGISSHVLDYDDTQLSTIIHPAGPVASALFALAEQRGLSGADFLHAFVLGVDVECRIGKAVYPSHYEAGWHITGTTGVFGAAAAAGKVLRLDARQMTWALGIAATQSAGFKEMFGTMCKAFHPGRAAQNGLTAALLAERNFTSSEQGIEAPQGFARVMASARDYTAITRGLGTDFEIVENTYKPFACGIVIHPVIDACRALRADYRPAAEAIERIELRVHPLVLKLTGKATPQSGLEGKFSVHHATSVSLLRGTAGPRDFTDETVRDGAIMALRDRVRATVDESLREEQARVTILLKDGRRLERFIEHAVGSSKNPMSDGDLEGKFRDLASGVLSREQVDRLLGLCWGIESGADAGDVARAAAG